MKLRRATLDDGTEVLLTEFASGRMTIATRRGEYASWGPPADVVDVDDPERVIALVVAPYFATFNRREVS